MNKYLLVFLFIFAVQTVDIAQRSYKTYKVGDTEYYSGRYYKSTGKPMVKRSLENKKKFLASKGLKRTPRGYEIDHIIPLSLGGSDSPQNMQLLTIAQHKAKTQKEHQNRRYKYYRKYYKSKKKKK